MGSSRSPRSAFEPDAALLICSDGLTDLVTSATILSRVEATRRSLKAAVQALIDAANQAGGKDNISVVLVEGERFAAAAASRPEGTGDGCQPPGQAARVCAVPGRPAPGGDRGSSALS